MAGHAFIPGDKETKNLVEDNSKIMELKTMFFDSLFMGDWGQRDNFEAFTIWNYRSLSWEAQGKGKEYIFVYQII